jgi:hypothetical protein
MRNRPDSYGICGLDQLPWSWSYLRRPTVLLLWLACAVISAFLSGGKTQRRRDVPVAPVTPLPTARGLTLKGQAAEEPRRDDRDDEARAA